MSAEAANETELNAAAWECADAAVALYKARKTRRNAWRRYQKDRQPTTAMAARRDFIAAATRYAAAIRRHKAATAHWAQIRPAQP